MPPFHSTKNGESLMEKITVEVIATSIVAAIMLVLGWIYHHALQTLLLKGLGILEKVWAFVAGIFSWFFTTNLQIPFWLYCLLGIAAAKLALVSFRRFRSEHGKSPWWRTYVEGNFFHVKWKWLYGRDGEIISLSSHCPDDGSRLDFKDDFLEDKSTGKRTVAISLKCEKCGKKFGPFAGENQSDIHAEVEKKIGEELRSQGLEWKNQWKKLMRGDFRFDRDRRRLMSEEEVRAEEIAFSKRLSEQQPKIYARVK